MLNIEFRKLLEALSHAGAEFIVERSIQNNAARMARESCSPFESSTLPPLTTEAYMACIAVAHWQTT